MPMLICSACRVATFCRSPVEDDLENNSVGREHADGAAQGWLVHGEPAALPAAIDARCPTDADAEPVAPVVLCFVDKTTLGRLIQYECDCLP
jgi:hypothetical protein